MNSREQGFRPEAEEAQSPELTRPAATLADLEGAADRIANWRGQMKDNETQRKQLKKKPGFLRDATDKLELAGGIDEKNQALEQEIAELKHTMDLAKPGMSQDAEDLVEVRQQLAANEKRRAALQKKTGFLRLKTAEDLAEMEKPLGPEKEALEARLAQLRGKYESAPEPEESIDIDLSDLELDMDLERANREFEPQLRAAEREVKDASEAFVRTINELLAKIEKSPLGTEMRGAIENSPDNLRLKQAIGKLDSLRKERAAIRDAVWNKYPNVEIPVTDDMIIGYPEPEAPAAEAKERQLPPPLPVRERNPNLPPPLPVREKGPALPPLPSIEALRESAGQPAENELGISALRNATSVDSLKAAVTTLGKIEGSGGKDYSANEMNELIDQAVRFPVLLGQITRANGLREKVAELIDASKRERQAELQAEYAAEVAKSDDLTEPEKKAAAEILEKNEVSPERRVELEHEIQRLQNKLFDIEKGAIIVDPETGKSEDQPGLQEMETKLEAMGIKVNDLLENKAVSGWESFKFGLKALIRPGLDRTIKQYEERLQDRAEALGNLNLAKQELQNPRKYAAQAQYRLMRTLGASASIKARRAGSSTGLLTMKF